MKEKKKIILNNLKWVWQSATWGIVYTVVNQYRHRYKGIPAVTSPSSAVHHFEWKKQRIGFINDNNWFIIFHESVFKWGQFPPTDHLSHLSCKEQARYCGNIRHSLVLLPLLSCVRAKKKWHVSPCDLSSTMVTSGSTGHPNNPSPLPE